LPRSWFCLWFYWGGSGWDVIPWFSASIAFLALRMLVDILLTGRLPTFVLQAIVIALSNIALILSLLVLLEIAWRAFAGVSAAPGSPALRR